MGVFLIEDKGRFIALITLSLCLSACYLHCKFVSASWFVLTALSERSKLVFLAPKMLKCWSLALLFSLYSSWIVLAVFHLRNVFCLNPEWQDLEVKPALNRSLDQGPPRVLSRLVHLIPSVLVPRNYMSMFCIKLYLKSFSFLSESIRGLSIISQFSICHPFSINCSTT